MNDTTRSWPAHRNGSDIHIRRYNSSIDPRTPAIGENLCVEEYNNDRTNYRIINVESNGGTLVIEDDKKNVISYRLGEYVRKKDWNEWIYRKVSDN